MILTGQSTSGCGQMTTRISNHRQTFEARLGIELYVGTLNVQVDRHYPIAWTILLPGSAIGEEEDFLFERCRVNGIDAFRIRPYHPRDGSGGHGDSTLEFVASERLRRAADVEEETVTIELDYDFT